MLELREELDGFVLKLKNTEVYREYQDKKNRLNENPELKQRVDDYRRRNYELQTRSYPDNLYDEMEWFQKETESLRDIPVVHEFLAAELALCRMIQKVTATIVGAVSEDFE